jgi:hypothetical protein
VCSHVGEPGVIADPNTFSPPANTEPHSEPNGTVGQPATPPRQNYRRPAWQIWLIRVRALLFVTLCATFGVLLLILPWTPKWTDNSLLLSFPDLREIVASGFARGVASGLGILDLWLGFWEAIHYHESG